jgi:ribonuclease VapC
LTGIVIDTSAVIAILRGEPEKAAFVEAIEAAHPRLISAVSLQEASMAALGGGADHRAFALVDALLASLAIDTAPYDADMAALAREAFAAFGKGRHSAGLNMGDCASYALARAAGFPLLFKGADFARTDIRSAL